MNWPIFRAFQTKREQATIHSKISEVLKNKSMNFQKFLNLSEIHMKPGNYKSYG